MTIKKSVKVAAAGPAVDAFIGGAPDASVQNVPTRSAGVVRGKKLIITVGFSPEMLDRIDEGAAQCGISRAAWINLACSRLLAAG